MALAAVCLIISLLAIPAVYAVDYTVGDDAGWILGVDYSKWASGKRFAVGDNLVFSYESSHNVVEVSSSDYRSCSPRNALNAYKGGNNTVPLEIMGPMYFICPVFGHCGAGMRLGITVEASVLAPSGTPSTLKDSSSGAGGFNDMNKLMLGISIVFVGLMGFMN